MLHLMGTSLSACFRTEGQPMAIQERVDKIRHMANNYRGIQSVVVRNYPLDSGPYKGEEVTKVIARGTEKAIRHIQEVIDISGMELSDNETHDHDKCLESARANGVPASWAHRQETYLSM